MRGCVLRFLLLSGSRHNMRIKIIGANNCARATRHLLQLAGFAVTEFLYTGGVATGPLAGYTITIDLAPAPHTPDCSHRAPDSRADDGGQTLRWPDPPAHDPHTPASEGASQSPISSVRDASSPAFVLLRGTTADRPASLPDSETTAGRLASFPDSETATGRPASLPHDGTTAGKPSSLPQSETAAARAFSQADRAAADQSAEAPVNFGSVVRIRSEARIHFDSVESPLEAAVLRHVTQLAVAPVILDRPGGVVHSDRELRIVAPNTGDMQADEAAAVAIEFGVLRGLLDLTVAASEKTTANSRSERSKKWWPFGILLIAGALAFLRPSRASVPARISPGSTSIRAHGSAPLVRAALAGVAAEFATADADPQGQFATGEGFKITDGTNFLAVDPCSAQPKSYASINQTANTQLVAGTASEKIYVCSIHVVAAAATNVAVVEGTGTVCGTGTAGVSGFGGATPATGWNFAANGGISMGNGDSSLGAEGTSGDNLCVYNSGSSQISGGISYVVQ